MKRSYAFLIILVIAALLPGIAISQPSSGTYIEYNTLGGGARAAGMGGAYIGIAGGEYAYSWNPANMIFSEKPSIGLQFVSAADKFNFANVIISDTFNVANIQSIEAKRNHLNLGFSGINVPFSFMDRNWAIGGGYRNIFDMKLEYESAGLFNSRDIFTQTDGLDAISVAVSSKVSENIGIGITGNSYIRGFESNLFLGNYFPYSYPANPVPDTIDYWFNQNAHYGGFNFDIGISAKYDMIQGGIIVHTPFDLKRRSKLTDFYMIPPTPIGLVYRMTQTTNIPMGFSLGVSARPIEKLTLALDFDNRPMSKSEIKRNWESNDIPDTKIDPGWQNLNQFRIGAEYMLDAGFADLPLRAGFRNNPSVDKEVTSVVNGDATFGSQINTNIITFGAGLIFSKAWLDIAYQFGSSSYNSTVDYGAPLVIEQKRDYSRLFMSAGMNF